MVWYISAKRRICEHHVDLSSLYLKEGASVLVANILSKPYSLYERTLPDEEYWEIYTGKEEVTPHDVIIVTRKNGVCRIYYNPDDQERDCARVDQALKRWAEVSKDF